MTRKLPADIPSPEDRGAHRPDVEKLPEPRNGNDVEQRINRLEGVVLALLNEPRSPVERQERRQHKDDWDPRQTRDRRG